MSNSAVLHLPARLQASLAERVITPTKVGRSLNGMMRQVGILDRRKTLRSTRHRAAEKLRSSEVPTDSSNRASRPKTRRGHLLVTVLGMVASLERTFLHDRQRAGIEAAKSRTDIKVHKGRKATISVERVRGLAATGLGPTAIAATMNISRCMFIDCSKAKRLQPS